MSTQERTQPHETLNGAAYDRILGALAGGAFQPGQGLTTRVIASELGISATPVREALGRLVAQNALELDPRTRAAMVPHITRAFLVELYDIRLVLDGMAVAAAVKEATDAELADLVALADELDTLESGGDSTAFLDRSRAFFFSVYAAARRPILSALLEALWVRSSVILGLLARQRPSGFSISAERRALVEALIVRNEAAASVAINAALGRTRDMVLDLIGDALENRPKMRPIR